MEPAEVPINTCMYKETMNLHTQLNFTHYHCKTIVPSIKENKTVSYTGKWMKLAVMLNERSQIQKAKNHIFFSFLCDI